MDRDTLKERTRIQQEERRNTYTITREADEIEIDKLSLELTDNFKDAFDIDKFAIRYTPLLAQYDYIVGDISAEQLRLKGFYRDDKEVAVKDKIMSLQDYLYEYVNFGAPYFVLENVNPRPQKQDKKVNKRNRPKKKEQKAISTQKNKNSASKSNTNNQRKTSGKRSFVIKQK